MRVIDVRKLKESVDALFDRIIDSGIDQISLESQYYWQVEESQEYDFHCEPEGYVVGDFFDDLETVEKVLLNKESANAYALTELAPIIAYLGKISGRKLAPTGG